MDIKNTKSFAFITNPLDVKFSKPIEIIAEHTFRKAKNNEIRRIKKLLNELLGSKFYGYPYEIDILFEKQNGNSKSFKPKKLPEGQWRYYVIEFKGSNDNIFNLETAANICSTEIHCNVQFIGKSATQYNSTHLFQYFNNLKYIPAEGIETLDEEKLKEIQNIYSKTLVIEKEHPDIKRSVEMFYDLNCLPPQTDLVSLGLFAVIESIITHQPKTEAGDSLRHQIKTKIPLLSNRFNKKINYSCFLDKSKVDTIWSKLYDYRSIIAHGGKIDFSGKLKILKDKKTVVTFLRDITKLLLRHAILEPQLYMDLRKC